jgi:hypothetical protein
MTGPEDDDGRPGMKDTTTMKRTLSEEDTARKSGDQMRMMSLIGAMRHQLPMEQRQLHRQQRGLLRDTDRPRYASATRTPPG